MKDAAAALLSSGAARLVGTVVANGTPNPIHVDIQLQSDGTSGSVTLLGFSVDLVNVGGVDYLKAPAGFWTASKAPSIVATKLGDRWVKLPSGSSFADTLTLNSLSAALNNLDPGITIDPKVNTGTLDGRKVIVVSQSDGSKLYVAATGKPYPVKVVSTAKSAKDTGSATLSGFGKHVSLTPPAGAIALPAGVAA